MARAAELFAPNPASGIRRPGHRIWVAATVWLLLAGNAAVVVWLWLHNGGVSAIHRPGDLLTSLGRITGLLGAYFLLVQVLLIGRVPWLERVTGFDRLTVWHRRNGKLCLYLVVAHVVLITLGYALTDRLSIPAEASTLLTSYPGMVTATVGTGFIILVTILSLVIVRRRLRYEAWYLVHLTAYAGMVLAWFHQIPTGNELSASAGAAAYWTALYVFTLALMVGFRILRPLAHAFRYRLRVAEVTAENEDVTSVRITGRGLNRLRARPGQFFLWRFLAHGRWWESHPFSLSAAPDGNSLRITVKNVGDFSGRIGEIEPGTMVVIEGPFGRFTDEVRRRDSVALIAGGIGITPIRALLERTDGDLVLIYRAIRAEDLVFRAELDQLARDRGAVVHYVLGDHLAPGAEFLMSSDHLQRLIPDIADREVYVCGPPAMASWIEKNVRSAGVPRKFIHTERFAL